MPHLLYCTHGSFAKIFFMKLSFRENFPEEGIEEGLDVGFDVGSLKDITV